MNLKVSKKQRLESIQSSTTLDQGDHMGKHLDAEEIVFTSYEIMLK